MTHTLRQGTMPILISMPHIGTEIPADLKQNYVPRALAVEDTDWHLFRLYNFAKTLGASVITPRFSRYVIDLNRPPNDAPMYPGASNTELCPTRFFTGQALYLDGAAPDSLERERRLNQYWQPYHCALQSELNRLKTVHGFALLWDAHSIRSELPWLFEGRLSDLNIGTVNGDSAHASITQAVADAAHSATSNLTDSRVTVAVNGRFKGGYITRHYGRPSEHIHAVQLEQTQCTYMQEEAPFLYNEPKAKIIQPVIFSMACAAFDAASKLYAKRRS